MADHLGDPGFAGQDIDERWLGDLEDAVPTRTSGSSLLRLAQQGGAAFGAVGALGVEAEAVAGTAQGEDLTIFYPAPMFRASVVLAPGRGGDEDLLAELTDLAEGDALASALADAGWDERRRRRAPALRRRPGRPPLGLGGLVTKRIIVLLLLGALAAAACASDDGDDEAGQRRDHHRRRPR